MNDAEILEPLSPDTRLKELPKFLFAFAKDPVGAVRRPLTLTWTAALTLQITVAILAGALSAAFEKSWVDILVGASIFPLITLMTSAVYTLFVYYFFIVFEATYLDMRRLYTIVVLATFPYFLLHALSTYLAPLDLIGFALTSLLLIVALCEQFGLQRLTVFKLQGVLFLIYGAVWSIVQIYLEG